MKRIHPLLFFLLGFFVTSVAQIVAKVDKIVKEDNYYSAYSDQYSGPSYVVYKLYQGGGDSSRKGINFTSRLPHYNYNKSGYDIGHLAPAEDFAYSGKLMKSTFKYYNALPQTPNLNRGNWKKVESAVRRMSRGDSLLIIAGGLEFRKTERGYVPEECFKVVYSLSTGKCLFTGTFTNTDKCVFTRNEELAKKFPFEQTRKLVEYIDVKKRK